MTRGDWLVVATIAAAALLFAPHAGAYLAPEPGSAVLRGPEGVTVVDLADPGRYVVPGRAGEVVFEVREGTVRAVSSTCPDQVCVHSGAASVGRPIVCAPNGVIAEMTGSHGEVLDAVSR